MDAKTLKYQFHSVNNELKMQIQKQQQVLALNQKYIELLQQENEEFRSQSADLACTRDELRVLQQKWSEREAEADLMGAKVSFKINLPKTNIPDYNFVYLFCRDILFY